MLLEHILFSFLFSMTLSPCARIQEEKYLWNFGVFIIYFWWMNGMFCVTPSVKVSLYMWVYVISITEA
jgi:hypothetical protein